MSRIAATAFLVLTVVFVLANLAVLNWRDYKVNQQWVMLIPLRIAVILAVIYGVVALAGIFIWK
jgi:hypothetical protein